VIPLNRSIGVSNFDADQLKELLKIAKVKPAVNQVTSIGILKPHRDRRPISVLDTVSCLQLSKQSGYSPGLQRARHRSGSIWVPLVRVFNYFFEFASLESSPITQNPSGPVTGALIAPATRLGATPGQVLFLWVRAKGVIIVTTSSKEERLREYLGIGHLGKYQN
jgi:diketogulonate reductase-like aldo/keto reductase